MIRRGEVRWADLGEPRGSRPAKRRPVVVIQSDALNSSRLKTTVVAVITSNTALASLPGNVFIPADVAGLAKDSVVVTASVATLDKSELYPAVGHLPTSVMHELDLGLRRALALT